MATQLGEYGPVEPHPQSSQGSAELMHGDGAADRRKKLQSRQLLSCTKCRVRKVKCDRIKPCSACCARGQSKECEFVVGEGNDYSPIQQSYELRKLRAENQHLRERLQAATLSHSAGENDIGDAGLKSPCAAGKAAGVRQRRFRTGERIDNLYFGTPGLANVVNDFAHLQLGMQSLTYTTPKPLPLPRAQDMYGAQDSMYPFPVVQHWTGEHAVDGLIRVLPKRNELFSILDSFRHRAPLSSFPHSPESVSKSEVERFLEDVEGNSVRSPDMLALIFVTLATGLQMGEHDRRGGKWVKGAMAETMKQADLYIAASMQALRNASYMNQPTLLGIQTLVIMGPYLTNSGRFLDAWTLFGTTIRMAHSIGLHRNPQCLDPTRPLRESMIRRTLWWWMLHMDQQYSVTLGRPLGISGVGDCPPPESLTTNPTVLRLGEFVDHFTILARQILGSDGMMSVTKIDEFTDKLLGLWDTMPAALQFNESWSRKETQLPDWPLQVTSATLFAKVQSFLILLNRQRIERTQASSSGNSSPSQPMMPPPAAPPNFSNNTVELISHTAPLRGRSLVIISSLQLLKAFLFFRHREPAVLICWSVGQQAFNACMILIIDAWETGDLLNRWLVEEAFVVFSELAENGVHKLAKLAVDRISTGLAQLGQRQAEHGRRQSSAQQQPLTLQLDTASTTDLSGDAVMGNTGMFLLEDSWLQSYAPQLFEPLSWQMAGRSALPSPPSSTATIGVPSPAIPISHVTAAPFPVISPTFVSGPIPVTNSPYAMGLQPRMPVMGQRGTSYQQQSHPFPVGLPFQQSSSAFTPINIASQQVQGQHSPQTQQSFSHASGPRPRHVTVAASAGRGPQGVHKLNQVPGRSARRTR
ncbi:hypothetical protein BAUCODRAFT_353091 [Baudoinia panamericana UAMH 10762]|uniref:Zn(2)-C6 fungal-type domain-containing protein n=1 Tax=Baudoinia panamericana (strain UAMH 10762) TaxID=717646 RepID=M2LYT6_BAUPA|nr:uncharacterized protein BAUCODRAFT_353091 [Baudoinia panamericana UAMH 10762]EMC99867.1 hypothetical protein BAUCODRAFT_353091 [Baudoinia panamericana UAMH 10762]